MLQRESPRGGHPRGGHYPKLGKFPEENPQCRLDLPPGRDGALILKKVAILHVAQEGDTTT